MGNGILKDVWGVRGSPSQVGISKMKKDAYAVAKWIQEKRKGPKYEIAKKYISWVDKKGSFVREEHVGWIIVKEGKPLKRTFKTRELAKKYLRGIKR